MSKRRTKEDYNLMGEEPTKIRRKLLEVENDAAQDHIIIKSKGQFDLFDVPLKQRGIPSSAVSFNTNGMHTDKIFHNKFWKADVDIGGPALGVDPMGNREVLRRFRFKNYPILESIIMRIFDEMEAVSYAPEKKATPFDESSDLLIKRDDFNALKYAWAYPERNPTLTEEGDKKRFIRKKKQIEKQVEEMNR
jgi:hypothetical protein